MLKDEAYFKKRDARLIRKNPIKFIEYVSIEMGKIAKYEGNKRQQAFYTALHSLAKKYLQKT